MTKRVGNVRQNDSRRRNGRTKKPGGPVMRILRGVLVAAAVCAVLVAAFAWVLSLWHAGEGAVTAINQCIKFISIVAGVYACVGRGGEKGALYGACVGAVYMALGIAMYVFLSGQQLSVSAYAADLGMGVAAGGLFGMILSNLGTK